MTDHQPDSDRPGTGADRIGSEADPARTESDGDDRIDSEDDDRTTVIAQGTFDLLHPGHVHYLNEAAEMGDELYVIVSRRSNVDHKDDPICADRQRRDVVAALEMVDEAVLGHEEDIFVPIEEIRPDVIALGHDQHHDPSAIEAELADRGVVCEVRRASGREPRHEDELLSTRLIVERILERRG